VADDDQPVLSGTAGSTATITLNRPGKLNAITPAMLAGLVRALETAYDDPLVKVIVLTGAGRAFSAGVDLQSLGDIELVGGAVGDIFDVPARAAIRLLTDGPKVAIAKLNGACFTGALELALACDLRVAANSAKIGDTHAKRLDSGLADGLEYEAKTAYAIADTGQRLEAFGQ
jgi:enoyl-CoA hydratase/carnithine racemase